MLSSFSSFADQVVSSVAGPLGEFTQELVVLGVFLVSYGLWHGLSSLDQRRRAGLKLGASDACQTSKKLGSPRREASAWPGEAGVRRSVPDARTKALEAQMLAHLRQYEFTRALNLYRSARPESHEHCFSEEFYTAFLESAVRVGKMDVVERLFGALRRSGLEPSEEFWRRVLKMMSSRKHFSTCLTVHSAFESQLPADKVVWSCLANAALELGDAQRAAAMLERYSKSDIGPKDHVLFFRTYLALKDADASEAIFRKLGVETSTLMFNLLLLTCVTTGQSDRALRLLGEAHEMEVEGAALAVDIVSYNTVIKGLAAAGLLTECFKCLCAMVSRGLQPDDITFATLLDACIEQNAMGVVGEIVKVSLEGKPQAGAVVYTLIKGLVRASCLPKALELCEEMKQMGAQGPDVVTYSVLIKALVDEHDLERAMQLVEDMKNAGHVPDDIIITHLLEGCRYMGDYELGKKLFAEMLSNGVKPSEFTLVTMLKLCGRVGAHQDAHDMVAGWEATYGCKPSVIHYTCLMSGCLRRKHYDHAWAAYELMKSSGTKPDGTTFSTLLPGMVAAQTWDRALALAKDALALPLQHKIPPETLNSALVQMQVAEGFARQAAELRVLMQRAGIYIAPRRSSQTARPQMSRA